MDFTPLLYFALDAIKNHVGPLYTEYLFIFQVAYLTSWTKKVYSHIRPHGKIFNPIHRLHYRPEVRKKLCKFIKSWVIVFHAGQHWLVGERST